MQPGPIRRSLKRQFPKLVVYRRVLRTLVDDPESYLHRTGWLRSLVEERPIDQDGRPLPWMNYAVLRFLEERLTPDLDLFEFGAGHSTGFYAARVRSVVSVEYDPAWFAQVKPLLPANAELIFQEHDADGAYCRTIGRTVAATGRRFDVVVIDGRDRVNCLRQSIDALSERGVMLLDDSQRERYADGLSHARAQGFKLLSLEGLKPTGRETDRTTICYRPGNCLDL